MAVQAKILRVMRLISMLQRRPRAISELAETLDTSTRSVYRYIILLEELGMVIDKDFHNRYFIHTQSEKEGQINFTAEESSCLNCGSSISLDNKKLLKKRQRLQGQEIQRRSERMLNDLREKTLFQLGEKLQGL